MECFELGPIRPPSEAQSILIRLTRNCHWNKCAFCPVYKGQQFSMRTADEVKRDIDSIAAIAEKLYRKLDEQYPDRRDNSQVIHLTEDVIRETGIPDGYVRQVAFWIYHGMESLFLQDADALVLRTPHLLEILGHIREKFPAVRRITTYSRAGTVSKKSLEEMQQLRAAGLSRIHVGMESGSDAVLNLINKGVTQDQQIDAGRKIRKAGFELSEYFMPGVGGRELSRENALESAKVINAVDPTFVRLRSVIPVPGTPLYQLMTDKKWTPMTEEEKVREIRLFIESLAGVTSTVKSDHIMNLIEDAEGTLPDDRESILKPIDDFLMMSLDDKESFIIGRRIGRYRYVSDFRPISEVEGIKKEIKERFSSVDEGVHGILCNYI